MKIKHFILIFIYGFVLVMALVHNTISVGLYDFDYKLNLIIIQISFVITYIILQITWLIIRNKAKGIMMSKASIIIPLIMAAIYCLLIAIYILNHEKNYSLYLGTFCIGPISALFTWHLGCYLYLKKHICQSK